MTYTINNEASRNAVNKSIKELRKEDMATSVMLRKVNGNLEDKVYAAVPTNSAELLAMYNGKEDITNLDATVLLMSLEFMEVAEVITEPTKEAIIAESAEVVAYEDMTAAQLTARLFADLGSEITSEVVNMTTGLKVKLDMLDELKALLRTNFTDVRSEVLTARLANALALTKEAKGSSLHTTNGNLAVYEFINSEAKAESKNFLFMADILSDTTKSLDTLILDAAFKSYKAQVALGALPIAPRALTLAVTKSINGIVEVNEDNKAKIANMTF